ncbi:MAG: hypothetical protein CMK09_14440 [Ponticaulis sp.]|nr:hypothetical protein [Ponticaulis sp.]|tara:strand:+ start:36503 stop:36913 length:411 start_codon:yes stop_codon:yes gene_type:complete
MTACSYPLSQIERPNSPNTAFIAPPETETRSSIDEVAPVFACDASTLFDLCLNTWTGLERVELADSDRDRLTAHFIARSAIFGFKDDICLEVVAFGAQSSSVLLYSASRVGYSDFGVNRKRVGQWMDLLGQHVENA